MTTKKPSRKQVLIPMSANNVSRIMALFGKHITNINRALKNIKLEVMANFIHVD